MDTQQTVCTASVWPHRHTDELTGPLDVVIRCKNQPPVVRDWPKGKEVRVNLAQPDERTNLTVLNVSFRADIYPWSSVNQCRIKKDGSLKFYLKSRITRRMEHPIPRGKWTGTCQYTDKWCMFTFQAMTMRVTPKIVLPYGPYRVKKTRIVIP